MVTITIDLPESVHATLREFLENGHHDLDATVTGAISLFLLQSGSSSEDLKQGYLKAIFDQELYAKTH